jgi:hypothetical protein
MTRQITRAEIPRTRVRSRRRVMPHDRRCGASLRGERLGRGRRREGVCLARSSSGSTTRSVPACEPTIKARGRPKPDLTRFDRVKNLNMARSTFIFAASLARSWPRSRRQSSRRALRAARQILEFLSASFSRTQVRIFPAASATTVIIKSKST